MEKNDQSTYIDYVRDALHNSVVQVIAQIAEFDWLQPYKTKQQYENNGTGFFIDNEGHFVTNAHVIDQATTVWIHIPALGQKPIFANIIGVCPDRDLALLRVTPEGRALIKSLLGAVSILPLGDSDTVAQTEFVLTLGYPLGHYRIKSSTGIVSGREVMMGRSFLQITAPINPGNSGGPVLNEQGYVVGIAVAAEIEAQNVGYAIPINELKLIANDLYATPLVRQGSLGVQFNYSSDTFARFLGNPVPGGFYINRVLRGSLFEKVGIFEGDMLYEFNALRLDIFGDAMVPWSTDKVPLSTLVARLSLGQEVDIVIYRSGKRYEMTFAFELTQLPGIRRLYPRYEEVAYEVLAGIVIMQLSDDHIEQLVLSAPELISYAKIENKYKPALVITHIISGSLAQQMRSLDIGQVIKEVNGVEVTTLQELQQVILAKKETEFLTIKTTNNVCAVFLLHEVLLDEKRLSQEFFYTPTYTVRKLIDDA